MTAAIKNWVRCPPPQRRLASRRRPCFLCRCEQEQESGEKAEEASVVKVYCQIPPIQKLDASLNNLKECEYVARRDRPLVGDFLLDRETSAPGSAHRRLGAGSCPCPPTASTG